MAFDRTAIGKGANAKQGNMTNLTESVVEDAALIWYGELGYAVAHGPDLAPGEPAAQT